MSGKNKRKKKAKKKKPTVVDIFCGAGGFSEGFKQEGFDIVLGIDSWEPAIKTFNHNYNLKCSVKNVLSFQSSVEEIEALPDTDVILGSPPCVTFSSSNISGKADKASGITLTQIFLRIVAVKKWKKNSKLKAWYMENVPSSIKHLASEYTFDELGLGEWAKSNKIGKTKVAIKLDGNQLIVNSADYGSPQSRERVISGEIIKEKKLIVPKPTHNHAASEGLFKWRSLREIKNKLPKPSNNKLKTQIKDPNYPQISIRANDLTDHFYDTGLYESEWKQSKFLKTNHPYMGRMSFPENDNNPSRTVTATLIGTSREAIIYNSDFKHKGNGEYRTPTIRESACLMGFPITYQFLGTEGVKCRLVGNAVCPSVSKAFASELKKSMKLTPRTTPIIRSKVKLKSVNNLNKFTPKEFIEQPQRNKGSRFRRHPFKDGNITVTLSNYNIDKNGKKTGKWRTSVQYGNGKGFPTYNVQDKYYRQIECIIRNTIKGKRFLEIINNGFTEKIGKRASLQNMYEKQKSQTPLLEPTELIEEVGRVIENLKVEDEYKQEETIIFKAKDKIPAKQLMALYAINKIATIANTPE